MFEVNTRFSYPKQKIQILTQNKNLTQCKYLYEIKNIRKFCPYKKGYGPVKTVFSHILCTLHKK